MNELLRDGEHLEPLNLSGWVVLSTCLAVGDEVIIDDIDLFDIPVRARIMGISSNNLVGIDLLTAGAHDVTGNPWRIGEQFGWFNIMHRLQKVVSTQP